MICIKKIFRFFLYFILAILLLVVGYIFICKIFFKQDVPMFFGVGLAVVSTQSMSPELNEGDLLIVNKSESFSIGDVITYASENGLITHRIIDINDEQIITKGDNNASQDTPITPSEIIGVVSNSIPAIGNIITFVQSPIGIILLLIPITIFVCIKMFKKEDIVEKEE